MLNFRLLLVASAAQCLFTLSASAQNDLKDVPDPDPELERKSFQVAEGFEVNLFASDPLLAKPIQMNFDSDGRLWVASSETYPQVKPGAKANDKIVVLEDADGDGRAEKTTIFADGLLIPTGVEPGDGGAYVANSTELLHFSDDDKDGKADSRRVVLSGFGTEDTHHILHTLRTGVDGCLYFNQSVYIHSHIETPSGVRRLGGGGIWRFRPESMQLEVFSKGLWNPWGHHTDRWGVSLATDGAGFEGLMYVFPGAVFNPSPGEAKFLGGLGPGSPKYCGLEVLSGSHLPDDWQQNVIVNDFRAHRVCRFIVTEDGAGVAAREQPELIKTSHAAFRPIDVKMGPDGAIYIADWYNPIIQHGEVDFRDERRDHTHGRIWRLTAKGRPPVARPKIVGANVAALLAMLKAPEDWTRQHARMELKRLCTTKSPPRDGAVDTALSSVQTGLAAWVAALETADAQYEHDLLEALWTCQSIDVVDVPLLAKVLNSKAAGARASAVRVLASWIDCVPDAELLLTKGVADDHPRVRLEAVRALACLQTAGAMEIAARAVDRPIDRFLEHALFLTARELQSLWLPALERGEIDFDGDVKRLTYVLQSAGGPSVLPPLMALVQSGKLPADRTQSVLLLIASLGGRNELKTIFDRVLDPNTPSEQKTELLSALTAATSRTKILPAGDLAALSTLVDAKNEPLTAAVFRAAAQWKLASLKPAAIQTIDSAGDKPALLASAFHLIATVGDAASRDTIVALSEGKQPTPVRMQAIVALAELDVQQAAMRAVDLLSALPNETDPAPVVGAFTGRKNGSAALRASLKGKTLPADAAKLAVRAARLSAQDESELVAALSVAGKLTETRLLPADQIGEILAAVSKSGDAKRGEAVFRRKEQGCLKCHAIGGAGGAVGPDISSIGASAQPDYLLESILQPSAKIKENFHALSVTTDEGRVLSGVKVRSSDAELVLRDGEDREITIPVASIEEQHVTGSLMPVGLADSLTRAELVDLVRYLSELGKGDYAVAPRRVVRRYRTPRQNERSLESLLQEPDGPGWQFAYAKVDGNLPGADIPKWVNNGETAGIVLFELNVTTPGEVRLKATMPGLKSVTCYTQDPTNRETRLAGSEMIFQLPKGRIPFLVRTNNVDGELRVEVVDSPSGGAQLQIVGGK